MSRLGPHAIAFVLALGAVAARALLEPVVAERARFLVPTVIVAVVAATAGRGPAVTAAVTGAVGTLVVVLLVDPAALPHETLPILLFALGTAAVVAISGRLRDARAAAEEQATRMTAAVAERDRALERLEQQHRIADRRGRILEGTQELSLATTAPIEPREAADRILEIAMGVLGASTGAIAVRSEDDSCLEMLAIRGYPQPIADRYARIPLDADVALARVAATGHPEWLEDGDARRGAAPTDVAAVLADAGGAAILPIRTAGRIAGVVMLGMPAGARIADEDRGFIALVARKAAQALERARLLEAQRRAAEAEQERAQQLQTVLETMRDGIAVVTGGSIAYKNTALDRLAGIDATTLGELADAFDVPASELVGATPREIALPGQAGAQRWVEAGAIPIGPATAEQGLLLIVRDVTEARAALAVRDAYVGMLSHELRTPITVILASAGLLERRSPLDDPSRDLLGDITAESERMSRLIDDLLVLSVPDSGPSVHPEPVLMRPLLTEARDLVAARHPGVRFEVDIPGGISPAAGDRTLLVQVVRNLLGNAIKYAGPDATIRLALREEAGLVETTISDDGPGIPAGERDAVFDIFFRSRSTVARAGGAGIGLFVCRRLVEAMGGSIRAEEAPGGGAALRFTIPVYEPAGAAVLEADAAGVSG